MLHVLNNSQSSILPLINIERVRAIAEGKCKVISGNDARSIIDYLLQVNSWLQEYIIKLV